MVRDTFKLLGFGLAVAAMGLAGCGTSSVGNLVSGDNKGQFEKAGLGARCVADSQSDSRPLVIHWDETSRTDLEAATKSAGSLAVVAWSCDDKGEGKMRVLRDCHLRGEYAYTGVTTKERVESLEDEDEIAANMPAGGLAFAAKLGASVSSGASLDIGIVTVGQNRTTRISALKPELDGDCKGATHFLRGWTVGAFAVKKGTRGKAQAIAELFGAGVKGASASSAQSGIRDGDRSECGKANPLQPTPPGQCGAPLQIELRPVETPAGNTARLANGVARQTCPAGLVWTGEKCAKGSGPYECAEHALQECMAQCERGNAASCRKAANDYSEGMGVARDRKIALELAVKSCDGGDKGGCSMREWVRITLDKNKANEDWQRSYNLWDENCASGDAMACLLYGNALFRGNHIEKNVPKAVSLFKRACDAGFDPGCNNLGVRYLEGEGVDKKDPLKAASLYQRACDGGNKIACSNLADIQEGGQHAADGKPDFKAAVASYKKACDFGNGSSCLRLARWHWVGFKHEPTKFEMAADKEAGVAFAKRGCKFDEGAACGFVGNSYANGEGSPKDADKAFQYYDLGCKQGHGTSCLEYADSIKQQGQPSPLEVGFYYEKACRSGEGRACGELGKLFENGELAKDPDKAASWYTSGCYAARSDQAACIAKDAVRLASGKGGSVGAFYGLSVRCRNNEGNACTELSRAVEKLRKQCTDEKSGEACYAVGFAFERGYGVRASGVEAASFYEKACEREHTAACDSGGTLYDRGLGGVKKDPEKARKLLKKYADLVEAQCTKTGDQDVCGSLGIRLIEGPTATRNAAKGAKLLEAACEAGNADRCVALGRLMYVGKLMSPNKEKGYALLTKGCKQQSGKYSCYSAASSLAVGQDGFTADRAKGIRLLGEACSAGYSLACDKKKSLEGGL